MKYRILIIAGLLLAALAVLQFYWTGRIRDADREQRSQLLERSLSRVAEDVDREISRARVFFQPHFFAMQNPASFLYEREQRWREAAPSPELVKWVGLASEFEEHTTIYFLDQNSEQLQQVPVEETSQHPYYDEIVRFRRDQQESKPRAFHAYMNPRSGLMILPAAPGRRHEPPPDKFRCVLVALDSEYLLQTLPKKSLEHWFGDKEDYRFYLLDEDDKVLTNFQDEDPPMFSGYDGSAPIFRFRRFREIEGIFAMRRRPAPPPEEVPLPKDAEETREAGPTQTEQPPPEPGFQIAAVHISGSLEKAVRRGQLSHLILGLAILAGLAFAFRQIWRSEQQTKALTNQKLEFVAGVSHELMTPLAAIRSASQNLADGVVVDGEKVRRYADMMVVESRRLADMLDQIMELAGMTQGRTYQLSRIDLARLTTSCLQDHQAYFPQQDFTLESRFPNEPVWVTANEDGMRRVIGSILSNAAKYAADGGFLAVSMSQQSNAVEVRFEDRGPGIAEADLDQICQPFFRGKQAVEQQIQGKGLGLALAKQIMKAHSGDLFIKNRKQGGLVVGFRLPLSREG